MVVPSTIYAPFVYVSLVIKTPCMTYTLHVAVDKLSKKKFLKSSVKNIWSFKIISKLQSPRTHKYLKEKLFNILIVSNYSYLTSKTISWFTEQKNVICNLLWGRSKANHPLICTLTISIPISRILYSWVPLHSAQVSLIPLLFIL